MATKVSDNMLKEGVAIPPGAVMSFAVSAAPVGWLACDGTSKLVSNFQPLFTAIGYTYGGSGSTFNVPNLQGQFVRGLTTNLSTTSRDPLSATRVLGNVQGDAIRNITGSFSGVNGGSNNAYQWGFRPGSGTGVFSVPYSRGEYNKYNGVYYPSEGVGDNVNFNAADQVPTAPENRPINISLLYCIKY